MKKILIIFGTRPEAIKLAPVIIELNKFNNLFESRVCVTGQHREMLDQVLNVFQIIPDYDLNIMNKSQSLSDITCIILQELNIILSDFNPDFVMVHGDTTTTLAASIASFYKKINVVHVEAGLRTNNIFSPWPEEFNRRVTTLISNIHFAPTSQNKINLINEGINENNIVVTGNTVIDSLHIALKFIDNDKILFNNINNTFKFLNLNKKIILVTLHRRESFGAGLESVCKALIKISTEFSDIQIVFPVHYNPVVRKIVFNLLENRKNIFLIDPLEYLYFIFLMNHSYFIISDSGGIQEEAPSLGKPVLVTRDTTERQEAVSSGAVKLVGTDVQEIFETASLLLKDSSHYNKMISKSNPYGNGLAASIIVKKLISL